MPYQIPKNQGITHMKQINIQIQLILLFQQQLRHQSLQYLRRDKQSIFFSKICIFQIRLLYKNFHMRNNANLTPRTFSLIVIRNPPPSLFYILSFHSNSTPITLFLNLKQNILRIHLITSQIQPFINLNRAIRL